MKTDLFYKDGSSDKVYQAVIEPSGSGYLVNFAYGRRGSTLTTGSKTEKPVDLEKAKAIFDKLIKEKMAKGYTPGEGGTAYQHTDKEQRFTGLLPQLLNPIEDDLVEAYIVDDQWCAQEKYDGKRIIIKRNGNEVTGINRKGLTVGLPDTIVAEILSLPTESFTLDGECIGDDFYAFDILTLRQMDHRERKISYDGRLSDLDKVISHSSQYVHPVPTAYTPKAKRAMLFKLRERGAEGVVFKRLDSLSIPGRPNSMGNQLKNKFYATASCVVEKPSESKHSVSLKLLDGRKWVPVGSVTIPQSIALPRPGIIVEIRYLYAYKGGSLFQPTYLGVRDDIKREECKISQLKFKEGSDEEE